MKLIEDITELSDGIANIDKAVAQVTADREAEKAWNMETFADAKAATTAFTQMKGLAEDTPETFDSAYQGNQDQAGGVMRMLEVIQSDFAERESTTTAIEAEAADFFAITGTIIQMFEDMKELSLIHI